MTVLLVMAVYGIALVAVLVAAGGVKRGDAMHSRILEGHARPHGLHSN